MRGSSSSPVPAEARERCSQNDFYSRYGIVRKRQSFPCQSEACASRERHGMTRTTWLRRRLYERRFRSASSIRRGTSRKACSPRRLKAAVRRSESDGSLCSRVSSCRLWRLKHGQTRHNEPSLKCGSGGRNFRRSVHPTALFRAD